jgi:hypothetical protein
MPVVTLRNAGYAPPARSDGVGALSLFLMQPE